MIQLYQTLDLRPIGIPQTLRLSQYDSDFEIIFELTNFDGTWILDTNTTAEVQGTKTDGHGYSADAVFDDQLKTVTIAGDVQMTAAAGRNTFEVVLFHDGDRLGSKNFILDVERAALDAETTASDSKIKNFTEMVEAAEDAAETATAAAEAAEDAAATFTTDTTLSIPGKAADAEAVGEALASMDSGLSDAAKEALLACFRHVAWIDNQGQTLYDTLEDALYDSRELLRISAVFDAGETVIYTDDSLDSLKQYTTVTAHYSDGTTSEVQSYTLSGELVEGTSTITVSYSEKTTTITITGVIDFYNVWTRSLALGNMIKVTGTTDVDTSSNTGIYIGYEAYNNRRKTVVVKKGIVPFINHLPDHQSQVPTDDYPIPVPSTANTIKVSITPNTQYSYINMTKYDANTGKYLNYDNNVKGWKQGVNEKSFTASGNLFVNINFKYDSAGSSYPVEPTAISIEFSEV